MTTRIAEIKERLEKATPGPWRHLKEANKGYRGWIVPTKDPNITYEKYDGDIICEHGYMDMVTADFIAHAPADIAWLLTELEETKVLKDKAAEIAIAIGFEHNQLVKERDRLKAALGAIRAHLGHPDISAHFAWRTYAEGLISQALEGK